jgi:G2/mitotic-specific cyclin 3/4
MLAVGGLKAAAKRTAFGDVSNTVKNLSAANDDSVISGKAIPHDIVKPLALQEKSAGFLRPAQRPLNVTAVKGPLNNNSAATSSDSNSVPPAPKAPLIESRPQPQAPANKRTLSKRGTTIYKDTDAENSKPSQTTNQPPTQNPTAPTAPVHQTLAPRQHKSLSQLKEEKPVLRRTQSRILGSGPPPSEKVAASDPIYEDAQEEQNIDAPDEAYESYMTMMDQKHEEAPAREIPKETQDAIDRLHRQLPLPPLASEPEEYWEEEEEEEIYDEQGYTTAHSYRSKGDNTTGGATTVLFPKITSKVKKELEAAKVLIESSRTQEEIEDEAWDTSMVAEYGDEIFAYMRELEVSPRTMLISPPLTLGNTTRAWRPLMRPTCDLSCSLCLPCILAMFTFS